MEGFAERLQSLIGEMSVSAFARKVGLSEALIRKYLKGAEPGLTRANQIAMGANCSLEWLATGCGYLYRQAGSGRQGGAGSGATTAGRAATRGGAAR